MSTQFERQLAVTLEREGANEPDGGFQQWREDDGNWLNGKLVGTKFGITAKRLAQHRAVRSLTDAEMRRLTLGEARSIYAKYYYERPNMALLPDFIEGKVFDMAVNHGPSRAVRILQEVLNKAGFPCDVDGEIGPETARQAAACSRKLGPVLINALVDERNAFFRDIVRRKPEKKRFLKGWLRRSESFRVSLGAPANDDVPVILGEPEWLQIARGELGVKENTSRTRHNATIVQYFREAGFAGIKDDETAWCAAFVGAVLKRAGLPTTKSLLARSYLKWGKKLTSPRLGCIVILKRGNSSWQGHVGFFIRETRTHVYLLGGNQSNSVNIAKYPKTKLLGYRWPDQLEQLEPVNDDEPELIPEPEVELNTEVNDAVLDHWLVKLAIAVVRIIQGDARE